LFNGGFLVRVANGVEALRVPQPADFFFMAAKH
jgi:hypothetical protein